MQITNYREINKGCLKSAFTVTIPEWGGMETDAAYFEKENGSFWINYAAKEYTNREGQKKSYNQTRWPQATLERLNKAIREKIKSGHVESRKPREEPPAQPPMQQQQWHNFDSNNDHVPF